MELENCAQMFRVLLAFSNFIKQFEVVSFRLLCSKMTKALMLVDEALVNQKDQLSNTGHTIEFVLQKLYEHNPTFVKLLGNEKVVKVSSML